MSSARQKCRSKDAERTSVAENQVVATHVVAKQARLWPRWVVFFLLWFGGCALDLATKHWVFQWPAGPGQHGEWWLVENYVGIQKALNQGALWGVGQGHVNVFAALSVLAAVGILGWVIKGGALREWSLTVALGGVLGGIFGNLYDRLGLWGGFDNAGRPLRAVRDWILFCYHEHTWPNFNIADCLLVGGAMMLAWHAFQHGGEVQDEGRDEAVKTVASNASADFHSCSGTTDSDASPSSERLEERLAG